MSNLYEIFIDNPKIKGIINSEQFPYFEKIMEMRIKLELSPYKIANFLGITAEQYIDFEYCDLSIPVNKYKEVLTNMSLFHFTDELTQLAKLKRLLTEYKFTFENELDAYTVSYVNDTNTLILTNRTHWDALLVDEDNYEYEYKITEDVINENTNISFNKFINDLKKSIRKVIL